MIKLETDTGYYANSTNSVIGKRLYLPENADVSGYRVVSETDGLLIMQMLGDAAERVEPDAQARGELRIFGCAEFLRTKSVDEIKAQDVTMLSGLRNEKRYARGYKVSSKFFADDGIAVERAYELVWSNGMLIGEKCLMSWYNDDGSAAFVKETMEHYTAKDAAKKLKDIRETQILYLQNPEIEYVNAQTRAYIGMLFEHYKAQVSDYILNGSKAFETSIVTESNVQIKAVLNARLDGRTIQERILEQIQWLD